MRIGDTNDGADIGSIFHPVCALERHFMAGTFKRNTSCG
jgi:predicted hydrocarbon binding protein